MNELFECPVCTSDAWESVERFIYLRSDSATTGSSGYQSLLRKFGTLGRVLVFARPHRRPVRSAALSAYERLRREVLFDVWFEGDDEVQLEAVHCTTCGFVCYRPRPDNEDIVKKYEYLKRSEPDQGGQSGHDSEAKRLDIARAKRVYDTCTGYVSGTGLKILDYGGGNGKLMLPFVEAGHDCHLIDYNDNPLPGVVKVGSDIEHFATDSKYDVIICSHVLEHVSDVRGLVDKLKALLAPQGVIYAEVPQEVWAGLKIEADPVTHINFFTASALSNLFVLSGCRVLEKRQQIATYAREHMEVLWVVATDDSTASGVLLPSDARRVLYPSRRYSLNRLFDLMVRPKLGKATGAEDSA